MSTREKATMVAAMLVFCPTCLALPAAMAGEASAEVRK